MCDFYSFPGVTGFLCSGSLFTVLHGLCCRFLSDVIVVDDVELGMSVQVASRKGSLITSWLRCMRLLLSGVVPYASPRFQVTWGRRVDTFRARTGTEGRERFREIAWNEDEILCTIFRI